VNKQKPSPPDFLAQARLQTIQLQQDEVQLFVPDADAVHESYRRGEIPFPYWSRIWPAAIALTEFVLQHPYLVENKNVIELGAGLGLPSLVAARFAADVVCTDHSAEAVAFANLSASHNWLTNFHAHRLDWNEMTTDSGADVMLLSDINYEPLAFDALMKLVFSFLENGKTILLSTPQRLMAKDFITAILPFCKQQEERVISYEGIEATISLFVLQN
jgi:predicted nicotinamide N-methyase